MKTAEQIAEEFTGPCTCHEAYTSRKRTDPQCQYHNDYESLVVVLRQYGAAVRRRAAVVAGRAASEYEATKDAHERNSRKSFDHRDFGFNMDVISHSQYCAAAIERMELP